MPLAWSWTAPIDEEIAAELGPVARLIHAFRAVDTDDQCRILNSAHRAASTGAFRRSPFTVVPVVFACLCVISAPLHFLFSFLSSAAAPSVSVVRISFRPLTQSIHRRKLRGEVVEVGVHKLLGFVATLVQHLTPLASALAVRAHACLTSRLSGETP